MTDHPAPNDLAERRRALGLTQRQVAARLGITPFTISRWEHGYTDHFHREAPEWYRLALVGLAQEQQSKKPAL